MHLSLDVGICLFHVKQNRLGLSLNPGFGELKAKRLYNLASATRLIEAHYDLSYQI